MSEIFILENFIIALVIPALRKAAAPTASLRADSIGKVWIQQWARKRIVNRAYYVMKLLGRE